MGCAPPMDFIFLLPCIHMNRAIMNHYGCHYTVSVSDVKRKLMQFSNGYTKNKHL